MTIMQHANKFTKLSRFVYAFVASKRMKIGRFNEGFAFYIHNQQAGKPIHTYQSSITMQLK